MPVAPEAALPVYAMLPFALMLLAIAVFPLIARELKTADGREASNPKGLVPRAVAALKKRFPELGVITDAALDPYTTHGQDGVVDRGGHVLNDETIAALEKQALVCAHAGVTTNASTSGASTGPPAESE